MIMKITLLVDKQQSEALQSEFGLSMLLESPISGCWLFDTGADTALQFNRKILNIPQAALRRVILSHGHYDHTGGLAYLMPDEIYAPLGCAVNHYSYHSSDDIHHIAMPGNAVKVLYSSPTHYISGCQKIADDLYLTGSIPRNSFEDAGGRFFHDSACTVPDCVPEEQALLSSNGVLISGCCHAGIINTMEHCRNILPDIKIHTIVGGLHLRNASEERLQKTADYLRSSTVKNLYIMHCTGENAIASLQQLLPDAHVFSPRLGESWYC